MALKKAALFPIAPSLHFIPVTSCFGLRSIMLGKVYFSVEHGAKANREISSSSVPIAEQRDFHMGIKSAPPANSYMHDKARLTHD